MAQLILTVIYSGDGSLREKIIKDKSLGKFNLKIKKEKTQGRNKGWAKVLSVEPGVRGALNISWFQDYKMLLVRAVTKQGNKPDKIIGAFVEYLLSKYMKRIESIDIRARK